MKRVRRWLEQLDLGQYAKAFEDNAVGWEILPEVTDEDLRNIGISLLGHRKLLLKAIKALAEETDAAGGKHVDSPGESAEAERRQLTVMFCDLVGSTALSASIDPEEMREITLAYQCAVAAEIKRYDGHIARFMGDGVMAYFGYPQAHEDDAERAIRSALAITETVSGIESAPGKPLTVRVGIATGTVVVGDIIGEGASQEHAVVGDTPHLAARLQNIAEPGTVAISPGTRQLLGGLFELVDLGTHRLKGISEPVRVWRPVGESQAESRFVATRGAQLTQMVGRDAERELLISRWQEAVNGEGQLIELSGEAGIGKSRIVEELVQRLGDGSHLVLRYYCSPYYTASALHPVVVHLLRAARISRHDTVPEKLDKLEAALARASSQFNAWAPLLADLLSIPSDGRYAPLDLTPQAKKSRTFEALFAQLEGLAARQPLLLILEDAHWLDPTTTELFTLVIERLNNMRVLLLVTFRPEFLPPWSDYAVSVTSLALTRLGRAHVQELIKRVTGGKELPHGVLEHIVSKTDGVPIFVEELTKLVLESDLVIERGGRFELTGPIGALAIPTTLHDSLMSRIDRDPSVKEVAQIGAVIGREFSYELLDHVAALEPRVLEDALTRIVAAELASRRGNPPRSTYTFKHALVQETAYQSLLKNRRMAIHARIAEVLEQHFRDRTETEPELLARHYSMAGRTASAVTFWQKAGERAVRQSANVEAIDHFSQGLSQLRILPESIERDRREATLQLAVGAALMSVKGQGAPTTGEAYARARELGHRVGDATQHFQALWGCWRFHFIRSELHLARDLGEECVLLAKQESDDGAIIGAEFALGGSLVFMGHYKEARIHLERAIAVHVAEKHQSLRITYGQDPGISSMSYLSWTQWFLGELQSATPLGEEALAHARRLRHAHTLAQVSNYLSMTHCMFRRWAAAEMQANETMVLSEKYGFPQTYWLAAMVNGRVMAERGEARQGIEQIERGIAERKAIGVEVGQPFWIALLAESYLLAHEPEKALTSLDEALEYSARSSDKFYVPEVYRIKGEALLNCNHMESRSEAAHWFDQALEVARSQDSRSLELRAATSLARLLCDRGMRDEARRVLAPVHRQLPECAHAPDLSDAEQMLQRLA